VKTTPKPSATKNNKGELAPLLFPVPPPLSVAEGVGACEVVDVADVSLEVDVSIRLAVVAVDMVVERDWRACNSTALATAWTPLTSFSLKRAILSVFADDKTTISAGERCRDRSGVSQVWETKRSLQFMRPGGLGLAFLFSGTMNRSKRMPSMI
jgi:hypothetical protein